MRYKFLKWSMTQPMVYLLVYQEAGHLVSIHPSSGEFLILSQSIRQSGRPQHTTALTALMPPSIMFSSSHDKTID